MLALLSCMSAGFVVPSVHSVRRSRCILAQIAVPSVHSVRRSRCILAQVGGVPDDSDWTCTDTSLRYRDTVVGDGDLPEDGERVKVHYRSYLAETGAVFDSSRGADGTGEPFSFALGKGRVIPGWEEGVATMRVGGKRTLSIPPELAYGGGGTGDGRIPGGAKLFFECELCSIETGLDWSWTSRLLTGQNKFLVPFVIISAIPYLLPPGSLPAEVAALWGRAPPPQ